MLAMRVPRGAVEAKMRSQGLDPALLDLLGTHALALHLLARELDSLEPPRLRDLGEAARLVDLGVAAPGVGLGLGHAAALALLDGSAREKLSKCEAILEGEALLTCDAQSTQVNVVIEEPGENWQECTISCAAIGT